jgi:hypothetical protein
VLVLVLVEALVFNLRFSAPERCSSRGDGAVGDDGVVGALFPAFLLDLSSVALAEEDHGVPGVSFAKLKA